MSRDRAHKAEEAMSEFDDREKAAEARFAHDGELRFRATARCNRLFGMWAAEQMGLSGEAAKDYAASMVAADFGPAGEAGVVRKAIADLSAKAVSIPETAIRAKLAELMLAARAQVMAEG